MRRLLLLCLLASAVHAQSYDALVVSQGAFGAQNSAVVQISGGSAPAPSTIATGRIYTQGAEVIGQRLYLTAGDSFSGTSRIDVLDPLTGEPVGQATDGLLNPRYLVEVVSNKAYVTNQDYSGGASFVAPFDLATNTVGAPIEVDGTPEGIAVVDGRVVVALGAFGGKDSLAVLDPATDTLVGYVDIECAARFVVGSYAPAWAICTDTDEAVAVDPATLEVVQRVAFDEDLGDPFFAGQDAAAVQLTVAVRAAGAGESTGVLISTASGVVLMGQSGAVLRTIPVADAATRPITALAMAPGGGLLYVGQPDADNPFSAPGTVAVYDVEGTLLGTFGAGVFPSYVALNPSLGTATEPVADARGLALALAGPHPVRQRTTLALTLDRAADVRVDLLDVLGRPVAVLAAGPRAAGPHRLGVEAGGLAAGLYLVRAVADGRAVTLPLTVAR